MERIMLLFVSFGGIVCLGFFLSIFICIKFGKVNQQIFVFSHFSNIYYFPYENKHN